MARARSKIGGPMGTPINSFMAPWVKRFSDVLALFLVWTGLSVSGVASAANAPSVTNDPCFIPPMLTRSPPESNGQPIQVKIGILLIDVVEIDDVTESFTADLKVRIRWKDPRLSAVALGHSLENCRFSIEDIWNPDIQPINQRGTVDKGKLQLVVASNGRMVKQLIQPCGIGKA
jgi:hypothetical protein